MFTYGYKESHLAICHIYSFVLGRKISSIFFSGHIGPFITKKGKYLIRSL